MNIAKVTEKKLKIHVQLKTSVTNKMAIPLQM